MGIITFPLPRFTELSLSEYLNMASRAAMKFPAHLRELRIHHCQKAASSQGVRDFVEHNYVSIKKANPTFPLLVRECSDIVPKVWARYEFGRETSLTLEDMTKEQVGEAIQKLAH